MHWINAVTIFLMIGSGWKIYDDSPIFGFHFADWLTIGRWAQHGLQVHFFGMWLLVINGLAYLAYGFSTGRYKRMLLPTRSISGCRTTIRPSTTRFKNCSTSVSSAPASRS
jgi:thiosulfate reductase cytochrome b subunit